MINDDKLINDELIDDEFNDILSLYSNSDSFYFYI